LLPRPKKTFLSEKTGFAATDSVFVGSVLPIPGSVHPVVFTIYAPRVTVHSFDESGSYKELIFASNQIKKASIKFNATPTLN
jgi:hypothetical protein